MKNIEQSPGILYSCFSDDSFLGSLFYAMFLSEDSLLDEPLQGHRPSHPSVHPTRPASARYLNDRLSAKVYYILKNPKNLE
eukprot:scaffold664921_cov61-Prasinocladus_malaysianus.AAC.2